MMVVPVQKYCRICWNTKNWRQPTGEAAKLEGKWSYVREHGFGHEEWLFNLSWLQPSSRGGPRLFRYGFLQPIGKYRSAYTGRAFHILIYTISPGGDRIAVAVIRNAYVPDDAELQRAVGDLRARGWFSEMQADLEELGLRASQLKGSAAHLINVRFEPKDVTFFDPRFLFPKAHKVSRMPRYQPLDWDDELHADIVRSRPTPLPFMRDGRRRSEEERTRAAVEGTTYSPRHVILQNALYDYLCSVHGKKLVRYERGFVDLAVESDAGTTYFEIKINISAKGCIREAFGQVLEYAVYPDRRRVNKLIVVGDVGPSPTDVTYLQFLRTEFKLPIFYQQWDPQTRALMREV
jgi:hypothetical protein